MCDVVDKAFQLVLICIDRNQRFQRTSADGGRQLRPDHVVDPRGCPGQIVHSLQELLRIFHAPADKHVEIDILLLVGEELGGPRIVDLHPPIDRQRRLIGRIEIEPASLKVRTGRPNWVTMTNSVSSTNNRQRQATASRMTTRKAGVVSSWCLVLTANSQVAWACPCAKPVSLCSMRIG